MLLFTGPHLFLWNKLRTVSHKQTTLMSKIDPANNNDSLFSRKKTGVRQMIKHNLKIDMTPMVDLGFLLISFFVITTELSKPTAMDLIMPKDGPDTPIEQSNALSILVDKNNAIYYYEGKWEDAIKTNSIFKIQYAGINDLRSNINAKQNKLAAMPGTKEGKDGLMLIIKPGQRASYKNIVDILDEITITQVKKYVMVNQSAAEKEWLTKQ